MTNVVMNSVVMSNVFMTCDVMNKTVAPNLLFTIAPAGSALIVFRFSFVR